MKQLIRFCIVGCLNTVISYSVFILAYRYFPLSIMLDALHGTFVINIVANLKQLGIPSIDAAVANVVGFTAGMFNSFVWNRLWTFKSAEQVKKQAGKFIATNLLCLLISTVSVFVFTDLNHWPYNPVWITTMVFVTVINFIASKYWVFAKGLTPPSLPLS